MASQDLNQNTKKLSRTRPIKKTNSTLEQGLFDPDQPDQKPQTSVVSSGTNFTSDGAQVDCEHANVSSNESHHTEASSIAMPNKPDSKVTKMTSQRTKNVRKPIPTSTMDAASQQWYLVTNHLNVLYMFAAGMILSPAGFNGKHYSDPSTSLSGWLPLFRGKIPRQALDSATQEFKYLKPCIVEICLNSVQAHVLLQSREGVVRKCVLPVQIDENISTLFIRAPLPLSLITAVCFSSQDDLEICESAASNSVNTNTSRIPFKIDPKKFEDTSSDSRPSAAENVPSGLTAKDCPPVKGQAVGGVMAMLFYIANRSRLCCCANRIANGTANEADCSEIGSDPILSHLADWMNTGIVSGTATEAARLYWDIAVELVDAKSKTNSSKPVDVVLAYLNRSIPKLQDPELKKSTTTVFQDMRSTFGLGAGTISDLFDRNNEPIARALILFCLRASCNDLLSFSHAAVSDTDFILAAILFGIRDGWLGLRQDRRSSASLVQFVESKMIEVEQMSRDEKLIHHISIPRPIPLREQLTSRYFEMPVARREALVKFVQSQGWNEAVNTVIRFPEARYNLISSQQGVEISIEGNVCSFSLDIGLEAILRRISVWPFEQENEFRTILEIE